MGIVSDIPKETQCHSKLPDLLTFRIFPSFLPRWNLSLRFRSCIIDVSVATGLHNSAFWFVSFFNDFHMFQREVSLLTGEDYTFIWRFRTRKSQMRKNIRTFFFFQDLGYLTQYNMFCSNPLDWVPLGIWYQKAVTSQGV